MTESGSLSDPCPTQFFTQPQKRPSLGQNSPSCFLMQQGYPGSLQPANALPVMERCVDAPLGTLINSMTGVFVFSKRSRDCRTPRRSFKSVANRKPSEADRPLNLASDNSYAVCQSSCVTSRDALDMSEAPSPMYTVGRTSTGAILVTIPVSSFVVALLSFCRRRLCRSSLESRCFLAFLPSLLPLPRFRDASPSRVLSFGRSKTRSPTTADDERLLHNIMFSAADEANNRTAMTRRMSPTAPAERRRPSRSAGTGTAAPLIISSPLVLAVLAALCFSLCSPRSACSPILLCSHLCSLPPLLFAFCILHLPVCPSVRMPTANAKRN